MSKSEAGKGSSPRPFSISEDEYARRWDAVFGREDVEKIVEDAKKYLESTKEKKDD
jgi:hypothetical protein